MTAAEYEILAKENDSLKVGDFVMAYWRSARVARKGRGKIIKLNQQTVRVELLGVVVGPPASGPCPGSATSKSGPPTIACAPFNAGVNRCPPETPLHPSTEEDAMVRVVYVSTKNRISPFVAMVGDWPDRAALVKTARSGRTIGWRPAIQSDINLLTPPPRHVAINWGSVRHRSPDLEKYYPGLLKAIRKHSWSIKQNLSVVEKKTAKKQAERVADQIVEAENRVWAETLSGEHPKLFKPV